MKKLFTPIAMLLLAFSFSNVANAQSWGFAQYGNWVNDVVQGPDGNYWACGLGGEDPALISGSYIVKLDENGEQLWSYTPFGLAWATSNATSVMPTDAGGVSICYNSDLGSPEVVTLDADGALEWTTDTWDGILYIWRTGCSFNRWKGCDWRFSRF